ncbi:PDZ domain-containing protein [bacterium]|nr:PDZ domain-containing protein [bacterium]
MKKFHTMLLPVLLLCLSLGVPNIASAGEESRSDEGFIGIYAEEMTDVMYEALDLEESGLMINDVVKDAPAEKAGLAAGDVLLKIDGKRMLSLKRLFRVVRSHKPGEKVEVEYLHKGKVKKVKVELAENKQKTEHIIEAPNIEWHSDKKFVEFKPKVWLGVMVDNLSEQLSGYFGTEHGVLVTEVIDNAPAMKAGIMAGDVIVKVKGEEIEETSDIHDALKKSSAGDKVEVEVIREKKARKLEVELSDSPQKNKMHWHDDSLLELEMDHFGDMGEDAHRIFVKTMEHLPENLHFESDLLKKEMKDLRIEFKELSERVDKLAE